MFKVPNYGQLVWLFGSLEQRCDHVIAGLVAGKEKNNGVNPVVVAKWNDIAIKVVELKLALRKLNPTDYTTLAKGVKYGINEHQIKELTPEGE